ncbi:SEC-C metal-binding domain-containing protein [Candidatus Palauibacter sp.]|uniref:SEC-C metal-binding domain-containing protein n=1 Tax=Candidatus Palauibacter sp. TaxID=3101350 RepID=UPI003B58B8AC
MKPEVATAERARLSEAFPTLELDTSGVPSVVTGTLRLDSGIGFSIHLEIPGNYPRGIPKLRLDPKEIPWEIDRHVYPESGIACLCVSSEYRKHWPPGSDLTDFLVVLVQPFLVGQAYYQAHGHWPPGLGRSHGVEGIIEAYRELLTPLGSMEPPVITNFMRLLARPSDPGGHETCPCGSGRRLRECHRSLITDLRRVVDPEHAAADHSILIEP